MRRALLLLPLLPFLLSLQGCLPVVATAATETGIALVENRSLGRKLDDNVIYTDIMSRYAQTDFENLVTKVTVNVRFARVMLTGSVPSAEVAQKAVEIAWRARGVVEVINELTVNPNPSMSTIANDVAVKKNLQGRLLITKDVWTINYAIDVVNGTAYMLGRTHDRAELNRAINVARTTKGVRRVVNYLQVAGELPDPSLSPSAPPITSGPPATLVVAPVIDDSVPLPEPVQSAPLPPVH